MSPIDDEQKEEIESRAFRRGQERAKAEQLQEEHDEIMLFFRDYRKVLDKFYASKMTETIVNTTLKVVLLAVLVGALALVVKK